MEGTALRNFGSGNIFDDACFKCKSVLDSFLFLAIVYPLDEEILLESFFLTYH